MRQCPLCLHWFKFGAKDSRTITRAELATRNPGAKIICTPCGMKICKAIRTH